MSDGKPLEDAVEQLFNLCNIYYLRVTNYRCFKCGQVQNSKAKGFPDFHAPALSLYVECKMGKGKLSKEQKRVRDEILSNKNNSYIVLQDNTDTLLQFLTLYGYIKP
jgi:hypothetical protein